MPRLFWKLFFSLWLSIMAFAVVVSWINQTVRTQNTIEEPAVAFEVNLNRFKARLARDMREGGEEQLKRSMRNIPRGIRNHIYILNARGHEVLGRDRELQKLRRSRAGMTSRQMDSPDGRSFTMVTAGRMPPRALLEPGPRGIGLRLGVAAVISALVSFLLAKYLARPLGQLSYASRKLATGDLSVRVGAPLDQRRDEFGQLALDMDEMAGRLQSLQQANRRLLRDVSHELRSPLARLRVALEIARNKDQSTVAEELNRIELESERLETLINEVLSLLRESSGSQELHLQRFDLTELLEDLVENVNYEILDGVEPIVLDVSTPLPMHADRELLWRVFENLLRNALIHSGSSGGIRVGAEILTDPDVGKGGIKIRVSDSGPGIAETHLKEVFEPFYRVDESRNRHSGGHGLGLAIAASAVRRHGGKISASNRKGGGLEVSVVLPIKQSA